jgi:uncharacterized protein YkwD
LHQKERVDECIVFRRLMFAFIVVVVGVVVPVDATVRDDQQVMVDQINYFRRLNGVGSVVLDRAWGRRFQYWCDEMAARGAISHDKGRLLVGVSSGLVVENVGSGQNVWNIFYGFVESRSHRANMLVGSSRFFGSCVTVRGGVTYTVNRFR